MLLWCWDQLVENPSIEWTDEMLHKYQDDICWQTLAQRQDFKRTFENIKMYKHKWCFETLEANPSPSMLLTYQHHANFDGDEDDTLYAVLMTKLDGPEPEVAGFMTHLYINEYEYE